MTCRTQINRAQQIVVWLPLLQAMVAERRPEVIGNPYLGDLMHRWVLFRSPELRVCLHRFLRSDPDEFHDHPKDWGSLILAGGYWEATPFGRSWRAPGTYIERKAEELHRVELEPAIGDSWSLFITGPSRREWGFQTAQGWVHWRDFVDVRGKNRQS